MSADKMIQWLCRLKETAVKTVLPLLLCLFCAACVRLSTEGRADDTHTNVMVSDKEKPLPSPTPQPGATDILEEEVQYNTYSVSLDVQPETRTVMALQEVTYKNRSTEPFDQIYFNLYLNAFGENAAKKPYTAEYEARIFGDGAKDYGSMRIVDASVNNQSVRFGIDGTVLAVHLAETLIPGDTVRIKLHFEAYVPKINHRTGADGRALWFGNFLPVLAVYDEYGWHTEPYAAVGNPFYTSVSNYTVKVTTPQGYETVGSGEESFTEESGRRHTTVTAKMVRDFAFAVVDQTRMTKETAQTEDGVSVTVYTDNGAAAEAAPEVLRQAVETLAYFDDLAGAYPYASLDIIETGLFAPDCAGYAQSIFIDGELLRGNSFQPALARQIGRQWFYDVVGSNQNAAAWLSEAPVALLLEERDTGIAIESTMRREYAILQLRLQTMQTQSPSGDLNGYPDWQVYHAIEGTRAKLMLYSLNKKMGGGLFHTFIRAYYKQYAFKRADTADFIETAESVYGASLQGFFDGWLHDAVMPPL